MDGSAVLIGAFVVGAAFVGGMSFGGSDPFPEFVPKFGEGETESHKCYVIAVKEDTRPVFAGCYSLQLLKEKHKSWSAFGTPWPFKVIAEYDRELDPIDLNPRY
ncbi:hypothetical protein [Roseovarius sp. Pro17]|uniref:hypothetical protein n=1 Tax=Roseovarius sp. Pro17 TaxID=3108175 RepID=UPI002D77D897|nr:hypothetical protein [Roseovarius sp. Pro17]